MSTHQRKPVIFESPNRSRDRSFGQNGLQKVSGITTPDSSKHSSRLIGCRSVSIRNPEDWRETEAAFANAQQLRFAQPWLIQPDAAFCGATVRLGHSAGSLWVYGVLIDDDPFNPIQIFNEIAFRSGDVFELFLLPPGNTTYFEIHVTPHNQRYQLRVTPRTDRSSISANREAELFPSRAIESWTNIGDGIWRVLLKVPVREVVDNNGEEAGTWAFSCGRYDWTRGKDLPVKSSISSHKVCDFHRQEDWMKLTIK